MLLPVRRLRSLRVCLFCLSRSSVSPWGEEEPSALESLRREADLSRVLGRVSVGRCCTVVVAMGGGANTPPEALVPPAAGGMECLGGRAG
jgi:hypothetical protein